MEPQIDQQRDDAAKTIQKTFRGYRARREFNGHELNAGNRWVSTIREAQFRETMKPVSRAGVADRSSQHMHNSEALRKWKKASIVARRAGHDDTDSESETESDASEASSVQKAARKARRQERKEKRKQNARQMGLQYFLEMVDTKHRYGSNLRVYHEEWKRSATHQNFFDWLDHGEGSRLELDMCPRDQLEREQVRYLTREERQFYLVKVDEEGRLCWAKNGARVDTTEKYKDSIHGIVPIDDETPAFSPICAIDDDDHDDNDDNDIHETDSSEGMREADRDAKYLTPAFDKAAGLQKVKHISPTTIIDKLLRKTVRSNTWIFVADTSFRLYVGIKASGAFQHSSFLQGGRISAAGSIKIKNGKLKFLSPLSGHYRPPTSNFRAFVKSLREGHVDVSHMTVSKSYAVLLGLEAYTATRNKSKSIIGKLVHHKDKALHPDEVKKREEEAKDTSESAEKERFTLEKEKTLAREEYEAKLAEKKMKRLSITTA